MVVVVGPLLIALLVWLVMVVVKGRRSTERKGPAATSTGPGYQCRGAGTLLDHVLRQRWRPWDAVRRDLCSVAGMKVRELSGTDIGDTIKIQTTGAAPDAFVQGRLMGVRHTTTGDTRSARTRVRLAVLGSVVRLDFDDSVDVDVFTNLSQ
jgi:hypothetical protein